MNADTASEPRHLFIVIPVFNRRAVTERCLEALTRQTFRAHTVVVVDDGSTDGTWEMLESLFPTTIRLRGEGTLWWTGATNLGCGWALARAREVDAVVTLNDDTEPAPDWLARLEAASADRPHTLVGSLIVDIDDGRVTDAGTRVSWRTARYRAPGRGRPLAEVQQPGVRFLETDVLCGCGTLIPVPALRELGPFDAALPQYGADYEFSRRAVKRGWTLCVAAEAVLPAYSSLSGIHTRSELRLRDLPRSFWSVRSANSWRYRWRFARRVCSPAALPLFVTADLVRVVGGTARTILFGRRR